MRDAILLLLVAGSPGGERPDPCSKFNWPAPPPHPQNLPAAARQRTRAPRTGPFGAGSEPRSAQLVQEEAAPDAMRRSVVQALQGLWAGPLGEPLAP